MNYKLNIPFLILLTASTFNSQAGIINIDGNLSDWGIQSNGNVNDWTPNLGIHSTIDDQHASFLDPGYGGQAYDAEALYAFLDDSYLYIAMATGHNPNTQNIGNHYGAGDFALDFGKNGIYEAGINIKPSWDTFGVEKGFYSVSGWREGIWNDNSATGYKKSEHPTSIESGELKGLVDLVISGAQTGYGEWPGDTHYFYEMRIDRDLLKLAGWQGDSFNIHWTMNCANDSIITDPAVAVPEPEILGFLVFGLLGMGRLYKRNIA